MIYFDNSATTFIYPQALDTYVEVARRFPGNPSSLHRLGEGAHALLDKSRQQIGDLLGVPASSIFFTSGGTESNNWVLKGTAFEKMPFGKHLITTRVEHPSVLESMAQLESLGFQVTYLNVDSEGKVKLEQLKEAIRPDTTLVSVMAVNNEVGTLQPILEIAELLAQYPSIHFHVDGVQALDIARDLLRIERIDYFSLSAHKFHGPRGVGLVYQKPGRKIQALLKGGGQEGQQRSSTENLPAIAAMAKAMRMYFEKENPGPVLRQTLWNYLESLDSVEIFSPQLGADHILCFGIKGVRGEVLVHTMEEDEIYLSTTSACSSKKGHSSGTLMAMGVDETMAKTAVRVSFSKENNLEELEVFCQSLNKAVKKFGFLARK